MNIEEYINIDVRWDNGIEHDSKSKLIFNFLQAYDRKFCDNYFDWKSGGDGDNGEFLMYQLDEFFKSNQYKELFLNEVINEKYN